MPIGNNLDSPFISIIVPVYNVEKYLSTCVDSILSQTFEDFELLLIDDGSTDNSGMLCDEYLKTDKRIKVIHQKNAGVSAARNKGIDEALGEYICFIDSDDWIDKQFLWDLYENAHSTDLKVLTSLSYEYPKNKSVIRKPPYSKTIYRKSEIIQFLIENDFFTTGDGGSCSKLFKRSIIEKDKQRFYLNNAAYEDTLFTFEYLSKCNSVQVKNGARYHYIHRNENSLSTKVHPYNNYIDSGLNGLKTLNNIENKYDIQIENPFFTNGVTKFLNILNYSVFGLYPSFKTVDKAKRIEVLKSLATTNYRFKESYKPNNIKQKIVSKILNIPNKRVADILFILLFKMAGVRKK